MKREFVYSLSDADAVFIFKEFAAREKGGGMSAYELFEEFKRVREGVYYYQDMLGLAGAVKKFARPGDAVLLLGAGDIKRMAEIL